MRLSKQYRFGIEAVTNASTEYITAIRHATLFLYNLWLAHGLGWVRSHTTTHSNHNIKP